MEESLKLKINNICDLLKSGDKESKILGLSIALEELPESVLNIKFNIIYLAFMCEYTFKEPFSKYSDHIITLKNMIEEALHYYNCHGYSAMIYNIICQILCILRIK